ncbi:hypothetical protein BD324DRAFT_680061 [Kockovaella imperatae]|uniref:Uncharacterized protein n=1 Tax=Kockovaella imperatae TaxID=4999 RepID=A0A1Y1ULD1_9TREE|nr:hypothetical protein BD324DRAFT_680061 [Kockovaella imperatae]ORX38314.1 hypothetical protein BD324DRAFT_680061 [Kockovaella imperatae]
MPREKVDYRAARAVLSAPYPLPVIITRSRAAASAPPPSGPPLEDQGPVDNASSISEIIPDPPPTPTTGGLAAQHGFPYNSKWKSIPPAFPPIPYPPKADSTADGTKSTLKLKKQSSKNGTHEEAEMMSGIEEGTSGEKNVLHGLTNLSEAIGSVPPPVMVPSTGLLSSAFETNLSVSFLSKTPSPPTAVIDKGKTPMRPPVTGLGAFRLPVDSGIDNVSHQATCDANTVKPGPAQLDRAWSPTSVSSGIRSWSAELEADEEDASDVTESPATHRLITPADARERRPLRFFGETHLAPFTYDPSGFESDADSVRTVTRIPRGKYKCGQQDGPDLEDRTPHVRPKGVSIARLRPSSPVNATVLGAFTKRRRDGSLTPTPQGSSKQAYLGGRSPTPTQAPFEAISSGFQRLHPTVSSQDVPPSLPSPVPMSVDPRSADFRGQDHSWPSHGIQSPLDFGHRQQHSVYPDSQSYQTFPRSYPPGFRPLPFNVDAFRPPIRYSSAESLRLPSAPPSRPGALPTAKACHNFLLQRKVHAANRRHLLSEYNRRTFAQAQREGKVLVASSSRYLPRQEHTSFAVGKRLQSNSDEDEELRSHERTRGAGTSRKRPRAEVSSSSWEDQPAVGLRHLPLRPQLLPPASILNHVEGAYDEPMFDMDLEEEGGQSPSWFYRSDEISPQCYSPEGNNPQPRVHFISPASIMPPRSAMQHRLSPPMLTSARSSLPHNHFGRSSRSPRANLEPHHILEEVEEEGMQQPSNELSAFNLMIAQAATQRNLKQREKDQRRAAWIKENRERSAIARANSSRRTGDVGDREDTAARQARDVSMARGLSVFRRSRNDSMGVVRPLRDGSRRALSRGMSVDPKAVRGPL